MVSEKQNKKKVLIFINSLGDGGAERAISNLTLEFKNKYDFKIVLKKDTVSYDFVGNIEIIDLPEKGVNNFFILGSILRFLKTLKEIRKIYKDFKPDTTLSSLPFFNFIASIGIRQNIPIVQNVVSDHRGVNLKSIIRYKLINLFSKEIIAVSEDVKRDLIESFGVNDNKIKVIYNSIITDRIQKKAKGDINVDKFKDWSQDKDKTVLINLASLNYRKGQKFLLKSFSKALNKNETLRLAILGKGGLEQSLKNLATDLNIEDKVLFLGFQDNPYKFLKRSDIFVLSSLWEGFPLSLLEALACGLPVISTDCTLGIREILDLKKEILDKKQIKEIKESEIGFLTPAFSEISTQNKICGNEIEEFSKAMIKLSITPEKREKMSKKALERSEDFDINALRKKWLEIIE